MAIRTPSAKPSPIALALQQEAQHRGLTAYAIAKDCGLPISTVQRALDGKTSPTLSTVEAIAKALGIRVRVERT
jgi:DNA-binding phage protein